MENQKPVDVPQGTTRCFKCLTKVRYARPAFRADGGRDLLLTCPTCGRTWTVGEKIDETREIEFQRQRIISGGDAGVKM